MYEADRNEESRDREKILYQAAFAGLHASEKLKREDFYMKQNRTAHVRVGRMAFVCMLLAALLCMMSVMAYAATGGETVNPVAAVKIFIDGQDVSGQLTRQEDGSYKVKVGDDENAAEIEIAAGAETLDPDDGGLEIHVYQEEAEESE